MLKILWFGSCFTLLFLIVIQTPSSNNNLQNFNIGFTKSPKAVLPNLQKVIFILMITFFILTSLVY
nr:Preprotein translocase SecG subunit [Meringosphaera mediterranea]WLD06282.1 Preprotein translocase SecG subunit [Meringosphaera mediterranea]